METDEVRKEGENSQNRDRENRDRDGPRRRGKRGGGVGGGPRRNRGSGGAGGAGGPSGPPENRHERQGPMARKDEQYIKEKLSEIKEPVVDLPPLNFKDSKFQSRCRLYVTNLPSGVTKEEFTELFKAYGEVDDVYLHREFFGFARMDHYYNAVKAKTELDKTTFKDKVIHVKFSPSGSILVKNLPPFVTNELVYLAFSVFGEVDYCTVLTDARGHCLDEAFVDFKYKRCVPLAKKYCNEHYYLLNNCLKPVFVEDCNVPYDDDGISEDQIKKPPAFYKSRQRGPRFAVPGSFEYSYAEKYKQLYEQAKAKIAEIKVHVQQAEQELEVESEEAEFDYETERLKELLIQREMEREHLRRSNRRSLPDEFRNNSEEERWQMRREGMEERGFGKGKDELFFEKPRDLDKLSAGYPDKLSAGYPDKDRGLDNGKWVTETVIPDDSKRKHDDTRYNKWSDKPIDDGKREPIELAAADVAVILPIDGEKEKELVIEPPPHLEDVEKESRANYNARYDERHRYDDRSRDYSRREAYPERYADEYSYNRDRGAAYENRDYDYNRAVDDRHLGWVTEEVHDRGRKRAEPLTSNPEPWEKRPRY